MRPAIIALAIIASCMPALAEEQKPLPPDPNQPVTLTLGELQLLLQAERSRIEAAAIVEKINTQIKPKQAAK